MMSAKSYLFSARRGLLCGYTCILAEFRSVISQESRDSWCARDVDIHTKLSIQCAHVLELAVSLQVLLATCFDDSQLEDLKSAKGQYVRLDRDPVGNIAATAMDFPQGRTSCVLPTVFMCQHHLTPDEIYEEV